MSGPDFDEQRRIRRGRLRHLLVVLGIAVALGVLLGGSVALGWLDMSSNREPPRWAHVLGLVLVAAGTIVVLCLLVLTFRSGRYRASRQSPLWSLSRSDRREVTQRVRRGGPVSEEDLPLLRHTATQLVGQRWLIPWFAGFVIMYLGQALLQWSRLWLAFLIVFGPLATVAVVQTIRDARRAEAFLRAHPVQDEP